jgi:hypothetical protein
MFFVSLVYTKKGHKSGVFGSSDLSIYVNDEDFTYQCERYQAARFGQLPSVRASLGTHCTRTGSAAKISFSTLFH